MDLEPLAVRKTGRRALEHQAWDGSILLVACVCIKAGTHKDRLAIYAYVWPSGLARSTDLEGAWSGIARRYMCMQESSNWFRWEEEDEYEFPAGG